MKGYKIPVVIFLFILMIIGWVNLVVFTISKTETQYKETITEAEEYFERGLYQLSAEKYEDALKIKDTRDTRSKLIDAWSLVFAGDKESYGKYQSALLDAVKMYPTDPDFLIEISDLYFGKNKYRDAYKLLEDAIELGVKDEQVVKKYNDAKYSFKLTTNTYVDFRLCADSRYLVSNGDLWGIIDEKGYKVIGLDYNYISPPNSEGWMMYVNETEAKLQDKDNVVQGLFSAKIEDAGFCDEELVAIRENGVYAYYSIRGDKQFGAYQKAGTFTDGKAAVCVNGKWGLVDNKGNLVLEPTYDDIVLDSQGRYLSKSAILAKSGGQYGLYDSKWNPIQDFRCDQADAITEDGIFAFSLNGKWGFADTKGKVVIEPAYENARSFSNGLAAVCVDGLWGFIDKEGTMVIPCQFLDADYFSEKGGCMVRTTEDSWKLLLLYITKKT